MVHEHVDRWCAQHLGSSPRAIIFERRQLSLTFGVRLDDGRTVVLKVRPAQERLRACALVQHQLWRQGYPCPQVLAGPAPFGMDIATAESYLPGGTLLPRTAEAPGKFATSLAELVALAPAPDTIPALDPTLPWVGWSHTEAGIWPSSDAPAENLNAIDGPAWLDTLGATMRGHLRVATLPAVIGHADWESQNLRWAAGRLCAVYDWDSVVALPEAMIAGAAAAVFPADRLPLSDATVAESAAFLEAYAHARGRSWSNEERRLSWAAGLWVRAFNAKKAYVHDPESPVVAQLAREVDARMAWVNASEDVCRF